VRQGIFVTYLIFHWSLKHSRIYIPKDDKRDALKKGTSLNWHQTFLNDVIFNFIGHGFRLIFANSWNVIEGKIFLHRHDDAFVNIALRFRLHTPLFDDTLHPACIDDADSNNSIRVALICRSLS